MTCGNNTIQTHGRVLGELEFEQFEALNEPGRGEDKGSVEILQTKIDAARNAMQQLFADKNSAEHVHQKCRAEVDAA